jgi:hypothetical protein
MAELFSNEWAQDYMDAWNADEEIISSLEKAGFNSVVAFGFQDEDDPSFVMTIEKGRVVSTKKKPQEGIHWDIRATKDNWLSLVSNPPGLMKLGMAYTSRKMRFKKGDYATMIRDPNLAGAFVKSFGLMAKVT